MWIAPPGLDLQGLGGGTPTLEMQQGTAGVMRDGALGSLLLPVWPAAWWRRRLCPDGKYFGAFATDWGELPRQSLFVIGRVMVMGCGIRRCLGPGWRWLG